MRGSNPLASEIQKSRTVSVGQSFHCGITLNGFYNRFMRKPLKTMGFEIFKFFKRKKSLHSVLLNQLDLIHEAVKIIDSEINDIDLIGHSAPLPNPIEELKRSTLFVYKKRYLEFYRNITRYLEKQLREGEDNAPFCIPNLRTLVEIYAILLYFETKNTDEQMLFCIARTLYTHAAIARSSGNVDIGNYEYVYKQTFENWRPFIKLKGILIPQDMRQFTHKKLKELKLDPSVADMLLERYVRMHGPETIKIFPGKTDDPYRTYTYYSYYVHGNALFKDVYGNEFLWLIAEIIMISSLLIELVNLQIINGSRSEEFRYWLKKVSDSRRPFGNFWRDRRNSRKKVFNTSQYTLP